MRFLAICTCLGALAFAPLARADDDPQPRPLQDQEWYGWQILLADAPLIAAWASYPAWSGFSGDGALLLFDMLVFTTVSPLIHAVHRGDSGMSVALRLGVPLAGALLGLGVGTLIRCTPCGDTLTWGMFDGAVIGAGLASLVDAAVFAWAPRKSSSTAASWNIAPFGLRGGGGVSAGGTF